jgi:hypothetical protein
MNGISMRSSLAILFVASTCAAAIAPTSATLAEPVDPVPHDIINQPYRACQNLDELTARIDNLYRKPFAKLFDANGNEQPEVVYFKDTTTGHEIMSLTRELCTDIAHSDLGRPVWTVDGRKILFMGNRGFIDHDGKLKVSPWAGKNYIMNADYSDQRGMIVQFYDEHGQPTYTTDGMPGKYNILDPVDSSFGYYADADKLYRVTYSDDPTKPARADLIAHLATTQRKIIQAVSRDRKLLIQDMNADPDRKTGKLPYMPEIHLVDLDKHEGQNGFYSHHPFDYGLPEVTDPQGKVLHKATNNYQFHSLMFAGSSNMIGWNYGPMTDVGEFLGWSLDVTNGLDGTPQHGELVSGSGANPFGQYESHGRFVGETSVNLYFSGPATVGGSKIGEYGLWMRDMAKDSPPTFITPGSGGHVAGGESFDPDFFAAHIGVSSAQWRARVKWSDGIVFGDVRAPDKSSLLCFTYSDVRGGTRVDRQTKKLTWSGMDNNDFRPYTSVPRPLLSRDATKVWFHSCMLMPTEEWTGIYVAVLRNPDPPTDLALDTNATGPGVHLQWKPAAHAVETKGFHVYRIEGASAPTDLTPKSVPARANGAIPTTISFTDTTAEPGKAYIYCVTAEEWSTLESSTTSNTLKVTAGDGNATSSSPLTDFDKVAPPPVDGFKVTKEPDAAGQYRLSWTASPAADLRYYNIYFSSTGKPEIKQQRLIDSPLPSMTSYLDWSAPASGDAFYAITAVDRHGNQSVPTFAQP